MVLAILAELVGLVVVGKAELRLYQHFPLVQKAITILCCLPVFVYQPGVGVFSACCTGLGMRYVVHRKAATVIARIRIPITSTVVS